MEEAIRSAVAKAVEESAAALIGTLTPAASPVPSSSSSTPTSRNMISRIHVKARWLIRMLAWVGATLDDGEDMDITDESIRTWLRRLQKVADAAEDLLDEFPHEVLRLGFVGDGGWTAGSITELPKERKMTSEMDRLRDQRMEDIVSRFMKIKKPEQAWKPDYHKEQMSAESISARRTTSSVIEQPHIVGRDEELAKVKQFLLSSDARGSDDVDDHVSVMAIVGMGGLGKTTLAQLAYNDDQVNQHFQLKSWVCVSEDFDVIRLTKAMLQSLNVEASSLSELDPLQKNLLQKLEGQGRLLLVLDDVWEADNLNAHGWNLLTAPLRNRSAGTNIIMTTRSRKVPEMAPRTSTYDLGFLSDEDTLELFMLHAFEGRDPNLYQNLVNVGVNIAKKCKGVPLAAKTLGGLLRTTEDEKWNEILESEVWDATINQEGSITPILRLSYQHLPAPLKRCFRYCSLFPKDYVFDRNQMICMWMAQGFIKANRIQLMEDIGQRYIDSLLSRSFFQTCPSSPKRFLMHDLMHDLARCVSVDECHSMAGGKSCLIQSDIRHLSINPTSDSRGTIIPSIKDIPEPNFFRSYVLPGINRYVSIFERVRRSDSYTRMEHLRVLDLGGAGPRRLPKSIARLKHLRYLRISNLVEELPEFVGSMHHLQTLDLEGPYQLPNSMSNLHNLRHIKLSSDVIEYPVGIGKLTDLQTLPGFRVSPKHNHAKLGELKDMNNIRGEFSIEGLDNLASVNEAKKACLDKKRNISYLHLEWDHEADSSPIDEEVLESLKPSVKLRSLKISGFKGPSYPSWLGDLSFSRLHTIKLEHCGNWASLPPLGQLPSLKSLYISEAGAVEYIGGEFFSGGFPQLEELTLENMYNWKSWCGAREGDCPKLKKLSISSCENLESLSLINLGGVEVLFISECPELRFLPGDSLELSHLQRVQKITIQGIYQVGCIEAAHFFTAAPLEDQSCLILDSVGQREAEYMLGLRSSICRLTVRWCWNLTSLPLGNLSALEYVEISECPQLRITSVYPQQQQVPSLKKICVHQIHDAEIIAVLFEKSHLELENVDQLVASFLLKELSHMIRRLTVIRCANLTSLPLMELTALKYLEISECNQLQLSSGSLQLPQSSSMLEINIQCIRGAEYVGVRFSPGGTEALETSCLELTKVDKLEALFLLNEFSHMIHRLAITRCVNLTSLPLMELTALRYLKISECNQLQLSSGSLQLPQSSSMLEMKIKYICGVEYIRVLFSPGGTKALETSCLELTNVDKLEALFVLNEFSHMIHRLTISRCANLTSLPWTDLTTLEYLRISECPMFQLLDAQQLPSTLQVLCIYGNSYETEQCSRHQHFQRLKQVRQCSEGGERNLYLVFRNVHDASAASKFCSMGFTKIYTLDIEWDCCTNDCSNVTDSITHEVLLNINSLCFSSKKLVIRGYTGSAFASWYADFFSKKLHTDFLHRLSSVSLLQCSKCEILPPLSRLFFLKELYVEGASSLGSFMQDYDDMSEEGWQETQTRIAFPELRKLEFHDMPMWKEWLGTREGDFPRLRKLILKHCPKLRALPHLPPSLQELELEACHVLTSLSIFDSDHTMSLISAKPFRWLSLSTSKGTSPILQHMSLTNCPLLLAWCEGHPRILADIPNLLIDGVRVHTSSGNSIRSQIKMIRGNGVVSLA